LWPVNLSDGFRWTGGALANDHDGRETSDWKRGTLAGRLHRGAAVAGQRLEADPDYYDAKVAGWWTCWGGMLGDVETRIGASVPVMPGNTTAWWYARLPLTGRIAGRGVQRRNVLPHVVGQTPAGREPGRTAAPEATRAPRAADRSDIYEWFGALRGRQHRARGERATPPSGRLSSAWLPKA
jgi:hypothetical protein